MTHFVDFPEFSRAFRRLLADLVVINEDEVKPESLLVDDLDADSVSFLELTYLTKEQLGVTMPAAKVDEETMNLPLTTGLEKLEGMEGDATFFEYSKEEAVRNMLQVTGTLTDLADRVGGSVPPGVDGSVPIPDANLADLRAIGVGGSWDGFAESDLNRPLREVVETVDVWRAIDNRTRRALFSSLRAEGLAHTLGGRVPPGIDPERSIEDLKVRDLFRFVTVSGMCQYLWNLRDKGTEGRG